MRLATTSILFAIALGLGIWINLDESRQTSDQAYQDSKVLARFQPETLQEIRINSGGIETVMSKHDDLWFFDKPVADRADQATTAAVLDLLSHLTIRDKLSIEEIKTDDSLSDQNLGFTPENKIQVTLISNTEDKKKSTAKSENKTVLFFGNIAPMANTIYARLESKAKKTTSIYVVDGNPRKYFEDPNATLRDQSLLFAPAESMEGFSMRTARDTIKLHRKITTPATEWSMTSPIPARANSELIEAIIAQLSSLRVESLLDPNDTSEASPNPVPEDGVVFELQLHGMEKPVSVFLSPSKTEESIDDDKKAVPLLEARTSDRPATFLVRSSLLKQLPPSPNAFRDPHLARIPPQRLHSIFIQTRDNPDVVLTAIRPADGHIQWKSDRNGKREPAGRDKIDSLVNAVNDERILGFVNDPKANPAIYGLDQPFTAITFNVFQPQPQTSDASSQINDPQTPKLIQRTLKLGLGKDDANQLFASFVGEPHIYQISPTFRNRVSPHPLKWKDPKVLSFSVFSLREIERIKKGQASLQLKYDFNSDLWAGKRDDEDISEGIDRRVAMKLLSTLGSLTAKDWITTSQLAYKALNDPSLTIKIVIEEIDRALQEPRDVNHTLKFAPTSTGFYYGSLDNSPDIFIIDRETYRDLVQPIIANPTILLPGK